MDLTMMLLILSFVLLVAYLLWFLFFTDTDLTLALAEKFGRPVSIYRSQVIWITGASTGLGESMAYELASVGAKLILTARNKQLLGQVKQKCLEIAEGKLDSQDILLLPFDLTDYDVHKTNVDDALKHFGKIDVLISNAGRFQMGPGADIDIEVHKMMFEVNFFGAVSLTNLVLKHFLDRGKGHIVVISSIWGVCESPGVSSYSATKRALHGYYGSLRMEHCKDNIHVSIVCPGFFNSEIVSNVMSAKKGEILENITNCSVQMPTSRCAHLTLIAAANKLHEAWIAYQPFLSVAWMAQYIPGISTHMMTSVVYTKKRITEFTEGRFPSDLPAWKPLFK